MSPALRKIEGETSALLQTARNSLPIGSRRTTGFPLSAKWPTY